MKVGDRVTTNVGVGQGRNGTIVRLEKTTSVSKVWWVEFDGFLPIGKYEKNLRLISVEGDDDYDTV